MNAQRTLQNKMAQTLTWRLLYSIVAFLVSFIDASKIDHASFSHYLHNQHLKNENKVGVCWKYPRPAQQLKIIKYYVMKLSRDYTRARRQLV